MTLDDMLDEQLDRENIVNNYLKEEHGKDDEWHVREEGVYHSSATGRCPRNNYFQWVKDHEPSSDAYPHFELGNRIEEVFLSALKTTYGDRYVKTDIPIEIDLGEYKIIGETDPIVVNDNLRIDHVFEVKSTGNLKYTRNEPKKPHLYQIHNYMQALDVYDDRATIVYINKYNLDTVSHQIEFDPDIWEDIKDRTATLHEGLMTKTPPDPVEKEEDIDYFCPHDESCCENVGDFDDE